MARTHNQTHRTTQKHVEHQDATDIQNKTKTYPNSCISNSDIVTEGIKTSTHAFKGRQTFCVTVTDKW